MSIFPVAFTKMSGTGNDFIIIDNRLSQVPQTEQVAFVRGVCRRMFSAGADGVIFIENSERADFRWRFYNSDGSVAEMCGNGSRCVARFAKDNGVVPANTMCFETLAGIIDAEVFDDGEVRVKLTPPLNYKDSLSLEVDNTPCNIFSSNTGVPHVVIFPEKEDIDVIQWGRHIRFHEQFEPEGTNVNFVWVKDDGSLHVRTYERGVEDETRACGTGAVAAAAVTAACNKAISPIDVITSGGDKLQVSFEQKNKGLLKMSI